MTQSELAEQFNVSSFTVFNWEKGKTVPQIMHMPILIKFLGYDPTSAKPSTIAEQLLFNRRELGGLKKWLPGILVLILVLGLAGGVVELL